MNKPLLVIDADSLLYRVGFSVEKKEILVWDKKDTDMGPVASFRKKRDAAKWINGEWDAYEIEIIKTILPVEQAISYLRFLLEATLWRYKTNRHRIFVEVENNQTFRHKLEPSYKANRDPSNKPVYYKQLHDYLLRDWNAESVGGIETDDAVSIICGKNFKDAVCVSIDKDLNQVPGLHYNPNTRKEYIVNFSDAIKNLYIQALVGDDADNIEGVYGIGIVKAKKLLDKCILWPVEQPLRIYEKALFETCLEAYEGDYERLNKNLELLYILKYWGDKWEPPMDLEEIASKVNSN